MRTHAIVLSLLALAVPTAALGAKNVTSFDSTQPRGFGGPTDPLHPNACASGPVYNDQGQNLCPIVEGIWGPQHHAGLGRQKSFFDTWKGMMMGNAARDPAFFALLSTVNRDVINLLNAAALACYPDYIATPAPSGQCADVQTQLYRLLVDPGGSSKLTPAQVLAFLGLDKDVYVDLGQYPYVLQPEAILPVTADLCLRCHFTVDWMEGRSEPPTTDAPYLKGQFWGSKFREYPGWPGTPTVREPGDSETGMEGIQCGYCHRQYDNYKRTSYYDASQTIPRGIGGYFIDRYDPLRDEVNVTYDFQRERGSPLCGTCHDVTNPLIREQNTALTGSTTTNYLHPIERTYTEWFWSDYGRGKCTDCHVKMVFQGAQTWLIEGLDGLWGQLDKKWIEAPYEYNDYDLAITPDRSEAYLAAAQRSRDMMADAALVKVESASYDRKTKKATVKVRIENKAGHKLPTGFAEGRQLWLHVKVTDGAGKVVYESGYRKDFGGIKGLARYEEIVNGVTKARTTPIKVYEHISLAKGYDPFTLPLYGFPKWNILDYTSGDPKTGITWAPDGTVSHFDKEFHFVLLNYIEKDNRIPPKGFNKAAYNKDGAFIVPFDPGDTNYPSGQYWDDTTYSFDASQATGSLYVGVEAYYQTFSEKFAEYLDVLDREKMEFAGGRARNAPCTTRIPTDGSTKYCGAETWGDILFDIWQEKDDGKPVQVGNSASAEVRLR